MREIIFEKERNIGRSDLFSAGGQFVFDREPHLCHFISWIFRWVLPHKWALLLNVCRSPENEQLAPFKFDDIFLVFFLWRKRLWPKLSCVMKRREQKESFSPFFKKKLFRVGVSHLSTAPKDNPVSWFCRLDNRRISQREHFFLSLLPRCKHFPLLKIPYCTACLLSLLFLLNISWNFAPAHVGKESGYSKECCFNEIVPPPFPHFQFFLVWNLFPTLETPIQKKNKNSLWLYMCSIFFFWNIVQQCPRPSSLNHVIFFSLLLHVFY